MFQVTRRRTLAGALGFALFPRAAFAQQALSTPPGAAASAMPQPGMRIVWWGGAASIQGERQQLEPDDNGEWVNKATGERFHQLETPGPAGMGFVVVDVLAAGAEGALLNLTQLLLHTDQNNATSITDFNGLASAPQRAEDFSLGSSFLGDNFWLPPAFLATLADRNEAGLRILHMPYPLAGKTYRAVRVQAQTSAGWSQSTFDLDSGLMLVFSSTTQGGPVQVLGPQNQIQTGVGSTLLTYEQFVGARRTNLPGPGSRFPDSVRRWRAFSYSGTYATVIQGVDMQLPAYPIQMRYDVTGGGGNFLSANLTTLGLPGAFPTPVGRTIVAGAIGSLWVDPGALAALTPGQVIDNDVAIGMQVSCIGRQNNQTFLGFATALTQQSFGYDTRTGLLTWFENRMSLAPATITTTMQFAGAQ